MPNASRGHRDRSYSDNMAFALPELSRVEETDKVTGCFGTSIEGPWKVGKGVIR